MVTVLAVCLAVVASAQLLEDYRFKGKIVDTKGKPLSGVRISLHEVDSGKRIVFATDANGEFDRRLIPHGVYDVSFEKVGYVTGKDKFDWSAASEGTIVKTATITLESEADVAKRELGKKAANLYREAYESLSAGDCPKAKSKAEELIAIGAGPYEYAARFVVARCLRVAGQIDAAIAEYTKVVESKPDLFEAQFDLANTLAEAHRYDEALARYTRAAELNPDDPTTQYEMGAILFNQGKYAQARPYMERAIALDPDHAPAYYALGYIHLYSDEKDFQEAKRLLSRYLELEPKAENAAQIKAIIDGIK